MATYDCGPVELFLNSIYSEQLANDHVPRECYLQEDQQLIEFVIFQKEQNIRERKIYKDESTLSLMKYR